MKYFYLVFLVLFSFTAQAQVSWMSRPRASNPYVPPVDQNILFQSLAHRQEIYDSNLRVVQKAVDQARREVKKLANYNRNDAYSISAWIDEDVNLINSRSIDWGQSRIAQSVIDRFAEYLQIIEIAYKQELPNQVELRTNLNL